LNIPDEGYSRNATSALYYISTFSLTPSEEFL